MVIKVAIKMGHTISTIIELTMQNGKMFMKYKMHGKGKISILKFYVAKGGGSAMMTEKI